MTDFNTLYMKVSPRKKSPNLTTEIFNIEKEALPFNFVSGLIRIIFFLLYVWGISKMKDVEILLLLDEAKKQTQHLRAIRNWKL